MLIKLIAKIKKLLGLTRVVEQLNETQKKLDKILFLIDKDDFFFNAERQSVTSVEDVRADHRGRYLFATKYLKDDMTVLDAACGIGYGTFIMANCRESIFVKGIDLSREAVRFANRFYRMNNNEFEVADCILFNKGKYDLVTSFETIEHVDNDYLFISNVYGMLSDGGVFIGSTPNESVMPFNETQFPFHLKHYMHYEIDEMLRKVGFESIEYFSQTSMLDESVEKNIDGKFLIFVCKK